MSMRQTVRYFSAKGHSYVLVFADRVCRTEGSVWAPANRQPGGWVESLDSADLLGVVNTSTKKVTIVMDRPNGGTFYHTVDTLQDAVSCVRSTHAEMLADVARRERDPAYALEEELKSHDWYYSYSDDGGVFSAGEAHFQKISRLLHVVPVEQARALWCRYAPKDFRCPV